MAPSMMKAKYENEIVPVLKEEFSLTNRHRVPMLKFVVVNTCLKQAVEDNKIVKAAADDIAAITGQRPVITRSKKAIANFKLRKGMPLGCRVTLRHQPMYDFVLRLFSVALPRVRDFKGVSPRGFDGRGNYTFGIREQGIFPEIDLDKAQYVYGMNVTFVTSARTDAEGKRLLQLMGMPFRN